MIADFTEREGNTIPKDEVLLALNYIGEVNSNKKNYLLDQLSSGRMRSMFDGPISPKISMFDAPAKNNNTLEAHFSPPLAIEDAPSKTRRRQNL